MDGLVNRKRQKVKVKTKKPMFRSRRERMTYAMILVGLIMFSTGVWLKVPTLETAAMYAGIAGVAAYYLKQETDTPSKEPM